MNVLGKIIQKMEFYEFDNNKMITVNE